MHKYENSSQSQKFNHTHFEESFEKSAKQGLRSQYLKCGTFICWFVYAKRALPRFAKKSQKYDQDTFNGSWHSRIKVKQIKQSFLLLEK
jgi:hypothetical protein